MSERRIVLVEDDESIRMITQMTLEHLGGWKVMAFDSGAAAVERAATHEPHLMLLDVSMPHMDGPQTLASLRAQPTLSDVPVVFLTAHAEPEQVARLKALGAVAVIAKPFDPAELVAALAAVMT